MNNQIELNGEWVDLEDGVNPEIGQKYRIPVGNGGWQQQTFNPQNLSDAKTDRIALVKLEARQRVSETDWEVTKYSERKQRGKPGSDAKYNDVLDMRDLIRTDSDLAEEAINALTTIEEVESFTW